MSSSSDNRVQVQLSGLGKFLPINGDLEVLKSYSSDVGVIVVHQALFTDFNWGKTFDSRYTFVVLLGPLILRVPPWKCHLFRYYSITCSMSSSKTSVLMSTPTMNTQSSLPMTGSIYLHSSGICGEIKSAGCISNGLGGFKARLMLKCV